MLPNLNRLYVHPLFLVGGFVLHTSAAVLFAVHAAPAIAGSAGVTVTVAALVWMAFSLVVVLVGLYRQSKMEGSVIAE